MSLDPPEYITEHTGFPDDRNQKLKTERPLVLHSWSSLGDLKRGNYLIKGVLNKGNLSVVYGESNSGKTFFALDIAAHISLGWRWQERNSRRGSVVYIAAESGLGVADRLTAFRKYHELEQYGDMHLVIRTVTLLGEDSECEKLIEKIKETRDVVLVVVDTLARAMGGGNENSSEDMGFLISQCDKIREETGAHVMLIHHSGKEQNKGARGHSSLKAAIDTEILVWQENEVITAQITKQRDGGVGDRFGFQLEVMEIGVDEDGDPVTSCALSSCNPVRKSKRLSEQKRRAFAILLNCLVDKGEKRRIRDDMVEVRCVKLAELREYLKRENISASDKPDSVKKAIDRAIEGLNNAGVTGSYEEYIWAIDKKDRSGQKSSGIKPRTDTDNTL